MDAGTARGLDGGGPGELRAEPRDSIPGRQAGRSVPHQVHEDAAREGPPHEGRTAAARSLCTVYCF